MLLAALKLGQPLKWDKSVYEQVGIRRAKRPGPCNAGRSVVIIANHFLVKCSAQQAFHYDVDIKPIREPRPGRPGQEDRGDREGAVNASLPARLGRQIVGKLAEQQRWSAGWAYDGKKNIYTPNRAFPQASTDYEVSLVDEDKKRERKFKVTLKHVATLDLTSVYKFINKQLEEVPRDAIQALDVVLRHAAAMRPNCVAVTRALYFHDPRDVRRLGGGAEAWMGYTQALKAAMHGLSLNIDMAATSFLEAKDIPSLMADILGMRGGVRDLERGLRPDMIRKAGKALTGVRVKVVISGEVKRKGKIVGVTEQGADRQRFFNDQENREMTVAEYFGKTYGPLKMPWLPCFNLGSRQKAVLYPAEVLVVEPGQRKLKLDERQTAEMIKVAGAKPNDRRAYIESIPTEYAQLTTDPTVKAFGLEISDKLSSVPAHILPPPKLAYGSPACVDVGTQGAWNLQSTRFPRPTEIHSWTVVSLSPQQEVDIPGPQGLRTFMQDMHQMLVETGIKTVPDPPIVFWNSARSPQQHLEQAVLLANEKYKAPCEIIMVLLPSKAQGLYREIKQCSDSHIGIPSQCFVTTSAGIGPNNFPKGRKQYCANLALKINSKRGGLNVKLCCEIGDVAPPLGRKPFMLMGADVTHPISRDENEPSVAAVVASLDRFTGCYSSRVLMQKHREEIVVNLAHATKELLMDFYKYNQGRKPEAIIFYRDGVSEGQFKQVLDHEYKAIREACFALDPSYCPPITFIVVQKRHNTRLFPTDSSMADRSGNVLPGTLVDQAIIHPFEFDFFLNSHAGIQGTSKPAHYHVLVDENGFGPDGMQLLTYWLCYLYCRCTRSVSYVPPAYYAHLAAFRGKLMVNTADSASETSSRTGRISEGGGKPSFINIHPKLGMTMFYV